MSGIFKMNVKVLGLWNPRIFNPGWLKKILQPIFPDQSEMKLEGALNLMELIAIYKYQGITILPKYESLVIETDSIELAPKISALFVAIMDALPQTPLSAIGLNFHCRLPEQSSSFGNSILNAKKNKIGAFYPTSYKLESQNNKYDTNLVVTKYEDPIEIEINFHYGTTQITETWQKEKSTLIEKHLKEALETIK